MKEMTLMVLAAGMGSRYGGLKQIDPVGPDGEIILDYSIHDAMQGGFNKVVFVIRRDIEQAFREAVGAKWEKRVAVEYAFQELNALPAGHGVPEGRQKPWGTGHAVLCAADKIAGPFAAINADDFYGRSGFVQLGRALAENADQNRHFMVGYPLRNTLSKFGSVSRGVCTANADGTLKEVTERTKIEPDGANGAVAVDESGAKLTFTGGEIVSMNFWGFMPSLFDGLRGLFEDFLREHGNELKSEFYLPAAVASMIGTGQASVGILESRDSWLGVTYREDKPRVQAGIAALVESGVYPSPLLG